MFWLASGTQQVQITWERTREYDDQALDVSLERCATSLFR
jgi:hypothetical protein